MVQRTPVMVRFSGSHWAVGLPRAEFDTVGVSDTRHVDGQCRENSSQDRDLLFFSEHRGRKHVAVQSFDFVELVVELTH